MQRVTVIGSRPSVHPSIHDPSLLHLPRPEWHVQSSVTMFVFVPRKHEMNFLPPSKIDIGGYRQRKREEGGRGRAGLRGAEDSPLVRCARSARRVVCCQNENTSRARCPPAKLAPPCPCLDRTKCHNSPFKWGSADTLHNKLCVQGHINCHNKEWETYVRTRLQVIFYLGFLSGLNLPCWPSRAYKCATHDIRAISFCSYFRAER